MEQTVHPNNSQTVEVIDQITKATLYALCNIGLKEQTALFEKKLNGIRMELFREGVAYRIVLKLFDLLQKEVPRKKIKK